MLQAADLSPHVAFQRFEKDGMLVPKGVVHAAAPAAHCFDQILGRGRLIAFPPKQKHGEMQNGVAIELLRTAHASNMAFWTDLSISPQTALRLGQGRMSTAAYAAEER